MNSSIDLNNNNLNDSNDNFIEKKLPSSTKTSATTKTITPRSIRLIILISTIIESIIFSGLIFGWPALFYMLKNENIYYNLCVYNNDTLSLSLDDDLINNFNTTTTTTAALNLTSTTTTSASNTIATTIIDNINNDIDTDTNNDNNLNCIAQENILNMAFTIGIFSMGFTSFAWGFLLESKGLRFVRIALNLLISIGCLLLSITNEQQSIQIIPAIILLGLIGVPLRIVNMQIADYFPAKRSTIIALFSGAFSASPIIFVLIKFIYDSFPLMLNYFWSTFILFIISITLLPFNTFFLPKMSVSNREKKLFKKQQQNEQQQQQQLQQLQISNQENLLLIDQSNHNKSKPIIINFTELQKTREQKTNFFKKLFKAKKHQDDEQELLPLRVSLLSTSFLIHQLWFSWINTYMVLYSGSMALWFDRITYNINEKNKFTQTFGLVQVSALIIAPISGDIIDRIVKRAQTIDNDNDRRLLQAKSGFLPILFTTITLLVAVICRFFDTSLAVYISIIFITILRSLFIAVASAYLRVRYPANHFNRLNGIMCTVGAFFSLLQFPLFYFESKSHVGALKVNIVCAVLTTLCLLNPLSLCIDSLQNYLIEKEQKYGQQLLKAKKKKSEK